MSLSLLIAFAMAGGWCLVIGEFSLGQLLLGLLFGLGFVLLTGTGRGRTVPPSRIPRILGYLGIYLLVLIPYDVVRSNADMARRLLRRKPYVRPGIVRIRLTPPVSETLLALVAHAITMSPGEMVVDYSADGHTMYVHLIDVDEAEERHTDLWWAYHRVLQRIFR